MRLRTGNTKRKAQFVVRRSCLLAECFMFQQQFGAGGQNHCHNSSGTMVWFERRNHIAQKEKHSCMYGRRFNHEVTRIAPQPNSTTGHSTLRAESKPPISSTSAALITKRAGYAKTKGIYALHAMPGYIAVSKLTRLCDL